MHRPKKILLVENEPLIGEILPKLLKPLGYEVMLVLDGYAALEEIKKEFPALIIVDEHLPNMDGFTLCKILKSDFVTSYIPIILLIEKRQIRKKILEVEQGMDDYILKPPDPIELEVRIEMALKRTEHQVHADSLTRLPGNREIEKKIKAKIETGQQFSFIYFDVDNFKSFNDCYGYFRGDSVIMQTARIIAATVKKIGNKDDFVGHVGGDDFVVVTTVDKETVISHEIIHQFDRLIPLHYSPMHRKLKYLPVKDRSGKDIKAPIMSISAAIVNNRNLEIRNVIELTEVAFEIKKYLKAITGSKYLINRRTSKKGAPQNKELIKESFNMPVRFGQVFRRSKKPLGQLLLDAKLITESQLEEALREHWNTGQLLGQVLLKLNLISAKDLEGLLKLEKKP
ncbi:MAG: diguanylate cyclase [Candidatus Omnitrophota bacterium]|nr:diguanylate cyclase [Candidatus Omnitrophota bacterium]